MLRLFYLVLFFFYQIYRLEKTESSISEHLDLKFSEGEVLFLTFAP